MAFSYSEGSEGFLDAIDAIDAAERLQQNVSVIIAGLNVVSSCGLYTYIDIRSLVFSRSLSHSPCQSQYFT